MSELRIGVVGCGGIGAVHLRSWAQVEATRVVAACDPDQARAEAAGAAAYPGIEEMLAAEQLDAVDICTPPRFHASAARAAIAAGLPVLCEKPLARSPEEAREMARAASDAGVLLMTAFCHRFHPPVEAVRDLIREGRLGRILMFRNRFGGLLKGMESKWFSRQEMAGGGALMDTAIHSVDLFRYLVGEVSTAAGATQSFHPEIREVEDSAAMLLRGVDGAIGVIEASWVSPWSANVVELYGEHGAAVIDYDTGATRFRLAEDADWTAIETDSRSRFVEELRHFAAVIRGEAQPRVTAEDGVRAVEVVYQAYGNGVG
ncbi:MAG: Gfo/Idh/MocA family protein [Armatimonadota bacterium]